MLRLKKSWKSHISLEQTAPKASEVVALVASVLIFDDRVAGVTRKLLGVEFSGESLPQITVVADVVIEGLDREVSGDFALQQEIS